jgi:Zn-dependent protease with chaperone function
MGSLVRFSLPSPPALLLYVVTIAVEVPVLLVRLLVAYVVAVLVLLVTHHDLGSAGALSNLGEAPTMWAIFALFSPAGGGWWWRQNLGGRNPSEREQLAYQDAIDLLGHHTTQPLPLPKRWFVMDTPQPDAAVCGDALMLSRGLFESEFLPAVIAHELGHLASTDGKLTAALNRLVINPPPRPPPQEPVPPEPAPREVVFLAANRIMFTLLGLRLLAWLIRSTIRFAQGGIGLRLTGPAWGAYWRAREYTADHYAATLGQADELADFLELHALIHDHPVPQIWLTEHTHPPTELRIARLRALAHTPALPETTASHAEEQPAQPQTTPAQ